MTDQENVVICKKCKNPYKNHTENEWYVDPKTGSFETCYPYDFESMDDSLIPVREGYQELLTAGKVDMVKLNAFIIYAFRERETADFSRRRDSEPYFEVTFDLMGTSIYHLRDDVNLCLVTNFKCNSRTNTS